MFSRKNGGRRSHKAWDFTPLALMCGHLEREELGEPSKVWRSPLLICQFVIFSWCSQVVPVVVCIEDWVSFGDNHIL